MTFEDAVDLDQRPSIKKRAVVAALLALAAIGTHWLPGRTIVPNALVSSQNDRVVEHAQAVAAVMPAKLVTGPNSLLGESIADPTSQLLASADVCQAHLDADAVIDQAGLSQLLNGVAPISGDFAVSASDASAQASAVPEPRTAGLFLLAAAPVFIRRRAPRRSMA